MTKNDLKNKMTSPEEAVKLVHDHDRVFIGFVSNITPGFPMLYGKDVMNSMISPSSADFC